MVFNVMADWCISNKDCTPRKLIGSRLLNKKKKKLVTATSAAHWTSSTGNRKRTGHSCRLGYWFVHPWHHNRWSLLLLCDPLLFFWTALQANTFFPPRSDTRSSIFWRAHPTPILDSCLLFSHTNTSPHCHRFGRHSTDIFFIHRTIKLSSI